MPDSVCTKALGEIALEFVANQIDSHRRTNRIMAYLDDFRLWVHVLVDDMCKELEGHPRRIGLLCVVILPLLLAPQASAATRANEFSKFSGGLCSTPTGHGRPTGAAAKCRPGRGRRPSTLVH